MTKRKAIAAVAALALVVAACGSDDDDGVADEPSAEASADEPADTPADTPADEPADTSEPEEASTGADESLSPVKIGLIAQDEELFSFPEVRASSQAMVDYLNAEHAGIGGHPIELVVCGAGDAPESHIECAQQFTNADDIHYVINGGVGVTTVASNALLAENGKPVATVGNDLTDYATPGLVSFDAGFLGIVQGVFGFASDQGITTMSMFFPDDPALEPFVGLLQAIAAENGINLDDVILLGLEPDLLGPISAANADNEAWFFGVNDPASCTAAAPAVKTVGYEGLVISNSLCLFEDLVTSGEIDGWFGQLDSFFQAADAGDEVEEVGRILDQYGNDDAELTAAQSGWSVANILIAVDVLEQAGGAEATDASVLDVLSTYSNSDLPGFPDVSCPGAGLYFGACNNSVAIIEVSDGAISKGAGFVELDFTKLEFLLEG